MVTDYDCWHEEEEDVTVEMLIGYLQRNSEKAKSLIRQTVRDLPADLICSCHSALQSAIITSLEAMPEKTRRDLDPIIGKYLNRTD